MTAACPTKEPRAVTDRELAEALRWGWPVRNRDFDALYPPGLRVRSETYWTPVEVARAAVAAWPPASTGGGAANGRKPRKFHRPSASSA